MGGPFLSLILEIVGGVALVVLVMSLLASKAMVPPSIQGFVGRPGSGKTYEMVALAAKAMKNGEAVYANFPIKGATLITPRDLQDCGPGWILIDEAHLWFPARFAMQLPPSWWALLSQTRKRQWKFCWSAQHEDRVDNVLKGVTDWTWRCTSWIPWRGHPVVFRRAAWDGVKVGRSKKPAWVSWSLFHKKVARLYDTLGPIEGADHMFMGRADPYRRSGESEG